MLIEKEKEKKIENQIAYLAILNLLQYICYLKLYYLILS